MRRWRVRSVRWPWLAFAVLLAGGIIADSLSERWSALSWLDLATYTVTSVGIIGVSLYALRRPFFVSFWRAFRWFFAGVITLEIFDHTIEMAKQSGYSEAGTITLFFEVAAFIGWIYVLQWIAMNRIARDQGSYTLSGERGADMPGRRDATGIIYTAGAILILNGPMQIVLGHMALGLLSIGMGILLTVQRILRNRKRFDT